MSFLLSGEFIHETKQAILVNYKEEKHWIPKNHCSIIKKELSFESGEFEVILKVEDWLAYNKGFSNFKPKNYGAYNNYYGDYEEDYENGWDALDPNGQ
jgi:hypothetical protein